ncbi:beta-phosphoglucomutase [Bavariicoccus seileri]|uniref:beta-phosphoglucomutase n=1 Tax=Bavariicoccus seileri TaxID=549685 RepID=UPI003F8F6064
MFKAVLFDLDGVITDTAKFHFEAWKQLAKGLGITIDKSFNEQLKGVSRADSLKGILAYGGIEKQITPQHFEDLLAEKNQQYLKLIDQLNEQDILPGILPLLTTLKDHAIKIALASASKNGPFILDKLGISFLFDTIVDPAKVAHGKPAPDIYLAAAKQLGVLPTEAIGIEDALSGIEAIKGSGALPVGVGRLEDLGDDIARVSNTQLLSYNYLIEIWDKDHHK